MADFVADTSVRRDERDSGLVHGILTERWSVWGPHGGHPPRIFRPNPNYEQELAMAREQGILPPEA